MPGSATGPCAADTAVSEVQAVRSESAWAVLFTSVLPVPRHMLLPDWKAIRVFGKENGRHS